MILWITGKIYAAVFPGTRLGTGNDILVLKNYRNCLLLDRRRFGVSHRLKAFLEFGVKVKILKGQWNYEL